MSELKEKRANPKLDDLANCYKAVMRTPEGKRVFADLMDFCDWEKSLFARDARLEAAKVARHDVAVRINAMLKRKV